jgi:hypothetical protein
LITDDGTTVEYTYGANPCISGIIRTSDNQMFLIHSLGGDLSDAQEEILNNATAGIVGGGLETLDKFKSRLNEKNIKISYPSEKDQDFNIVIVKEKNTSRVKPGIYYCYEDNDLY